MNEGGNLEDPAKTARDSVCPHTTAHCAEHYGHPAYSCSARSARSSLLTPIATRHRKVRAVRMPLLKLSGRMVVAVLLTGATPFASPFAAAAQGVGHSFFMRGTIVAMSGRIPTICVGKADGAAVGQTLTVVRVRAAAGGKPGSPTFRRTDVGTIRITSLVDDHFARASVISGSPAKNDLVELRRDGTSVSATCNQSRKSAMPKEMAMPGKADCISMKQDK